MRQECLDTVSQVMGRRFTNEEGDALVERIQAAMTELRRADPNFSSKSFDDQVAQAANVLALESTQRAARRKEVYLLQAVKQNQALTKMDRLAKEEDTHAYKAVGRMMADIDHKAKGIANDYLSDMLDTINGIGSKWFGMIEDPKDVYDFVCEAFGQNSGNERAKQAWAAWQKTAESLRLRANANGADIGKLDYGYIPQSHDGWKLTKAHRILKTKGRSAKDAWIDFISPLLDRSQYVDEYGHPMSDDRYREMLGRVYDTIITNGSTEDDIFRIAQNRPETLAQRQRFPHRKLHFKSPEAWIEYESKFAKGSLSSTLIQHVQKMASTIAIMEDWGPEPQATFDLLKFTADQVANNAIKQMQEANTATGVRGRISSMRNAFTRNFQYKDSQGVFVNLDQIWSVLTGEAYRVETNNRPLADFMQGWRNLEVAGKLGKAFITSFSDIPTYFIATGFNRMGYLDGLKFLGRAYGRDWKEFAARTGIMAESMISDFNRWAGDNLGENWTGKVANATLRASFLTGFTDATRRAFSLNMMASMGKLINTDWNALNTFDRARLENADITMSDWQIYQAAGVDTFKGVSFLNPKSIRELSGFDELAKQQAESKLIAFVVQESERASLEPDLITRASTTRGRQKGTAEGELARALFLFKSFPIAMMRQHYQRAQFLGRYGDRGDRLKYAASLIVGTTVMGAISLQVQNLLNGKDLQDTSSREFWLNAFTKGGGLGFLGDFIANQVSENARYGAYSTVQFLGPQASTALEALDTLTKATGNALYDKETRPLASTVRLIRSHMPFVNMWYTSTAIDRYVMNDIQEYLSPGYLARMERRTYRSWGQGYWWGPRDNTPRRAPRMADQPDF